MVIITDILALLLKFLSSSQLEKKIFLNFIGTVREKVDKLTLIEHLFYASYFLHDIKFNILQKYRAKRKKKSIRFLFCRKNYKVQRLANLPKKPLLVIYSTRIPKEDTAQHRGITQDLPFSLFSGSKTQALSTYLLLLFLSLLYKMSSKER